VAKNKTEAKGEEKKNAETTFCSQWFRHFKDGVYLDTWEPVSHLPDGMQVAGNTAWRWEDGTYVEGYIWQLNGTPGSKQWATQSKGPRKDRLF